MIRWIDEVKLIPHLPPQVRSVMIAAGHDDRAPGIVANGHREAEIVLAFRDLVSAELAELGIRHVCDGGPGENLPLREAVRLAQQCDIAVEFHANGGPASATGVETLSRAHNKPLGRRLCAVTAEVLGIRDRGAKPESSGQHSRLAFVSDGGGIIHELFFLSNASDLAAYQRHRERLAQVVAATLADAARAE